MKLLRKCTLFLPLAAALSLSAPSWAVGTLSEKDARQTAETTMTPNNMHAYLSFIASDELMGRDTPSAGLNTAARYIATFLEKWGFTPKGDDGTYFQKIAIRSLVIDGTKSTATIGGKALHYGDDFLVSGASEDNTTVATPAPLVYVGHGWLIKSKNIDAYRGIDVRGKIVVLAAGGLPAGLSFRDLPREGRGTDWMTPDQYAAASGAVGIIHLPDTADSAAWKDQMPKPNPIRRIGTAPVGIGEGGKINGGMPSITLSPDAATALFEGEQISLAKAMDNAKTQAEAGAFMFGNSKRATLGISGTIDTVYTQNIVAAWEGSDPKLKDQYLAFGAHYDHVGVNDSPTATGDKIFNGADDDGSGTVALLSMAETLGKQPTNRPKRSILFVWHCGEEKGLWGSEYFTSHPTVPEKDIVTQLNIDMIGRSKKDSNDPNPRNATLSGPDTIYVIGARMLSTDLGDIVDKTNNDYTKLKYDFKYDDPKDPNRFYYRSDHYNYAKHGIPIAFFFDGVHEDYHRPGDEVSKIDFVKYSRVARTIFLTGVNVANRDKAPFVDKELSADRKQ